MTPKQKTICRAAVALVLSQIRHNEKLSLGVYLDACSLAGFAENVNPFEATEAELENLLKVLKDDLSHT